MVKIAFLSPQINVRGTCNAVYWYAHYNEVLLGGSSIVIARNDHHHDSDQISIKKFNDRFPLLWIDKPEDIDTIIKQYKVDILYSIKYGKRDEWISKTVKNVIHCVFDLSEPHGDVYAAVSKSLAEKYNTNLYVPHMIALEKGNKNDNMRRELKIPDDALVFGRHGGEDTFNIHYCKEIVLKLANERNNYYFVFVNTPVFCNHNKVIFLDKISDNDDKNRYLNTLDAYLECNTLGHSFGIALGEASVNDLPLIIYNGEVWNRSHLDIVGNRAFLFKTPGEFYNILSNFKKEYFLNKDLNCYKEFNPRNVMLQFKKVFID